ncbi:hypothetical protein Vi05172_g7356 [Venturia inaequalis]|nr:hypothetical protein Vi05172_g7356 [Venturia inaequalis]
MIIFVVELPGASKLPPHAHASNYPPSRQEPSNQSTRTSLQISLHIEQQDLTSKSPFVLLHFHVHRVRVAVITISTLIRAPLIHPAKKSDQKTELTVFVPHLQTSDFTVVLLPKLASKPKTQSLGSRPAIQYRWAGKPEAAPSFREQS